MLIRAGAAKEAMLATTNTAEAPWTIVKSNDKKRARLEAMRWVLARFPYSDRDDEIVGEPDGRIVGPPSVVYEVGEHLTHEAPSVA